MPSGQDNKPKMIQAQLLSIMISLGVTSCLNCMHFKVNALNRFSYRQCLRMELNNDEIGKNEEKCLTQEGKASVNVVDRTNFYLKDERKHGRSVPFPPFAKEHMRQLREENLDEDFFLSLDKEKRRKARLQENRAYSRPYQFASVNATLPPTSTDLESPESQDSNTYLAGRMSLVYKAAVATISFIAFPYISELVSNSITNTSPGDLGKIASTFVPGISIVYGTFVSLTLSILYNRMSDIQNHVSVESSLLSLIARDLLILFRYRKQYAIDACQFVADQVRLLVRESRGSEVMGLIYCDPYARILEIVAEYEHEISLMSKGESLEEEKSRCIGLITCVRDTCKEAITARVLRLSAESVSLPSTHLQVLTALTSLMLLGFTISSIASSITSSAVTNLENSAMFSMLFSVYVLVYKYIEDLDSPFEGAYQIRRSSIASNLLQIKLLLCNHPLTSGKVDFDDYADVEEIATSTWQVKSKKRNDNGVTCRTPGLGSRVYRMKDFQ